MDVQKHVSPGSVQFTAIMSTAARRCAYREPGWPSTRSWMAMARRSHARTPRNAYRTGSPSSSDTSKPAAVRVADHSRSRGGCRNRFQLCGPAACPKAAVSSRRRSWYPPGSRVTPQPAAAPPPTTVR